MDQIIIAHGQPVSFKAFSTKALMVMSASLARPAGCLRSSLRVARQSG
jgi:hypothetical protein